MKVEFQNITYDCSINGVDHSATVLPTLATCAVLSGIRRGSNLAMLARDDVFTRHLEGDWLITGFDYRAEGRTRWRRHDEDMAWRR